MPQLRDSGNHPISDASQSASTGMRDVRGGPDRFDRIFGIETEYGVSVTGCDATCDAGRVAMEMFRPVVAHTRSTNTYLENGSRLYLDVGSHPEYATAEARDPMDALAQDLAGELVMRRLACHAQERLRQTYGDGLTVHTYKNNADSAGHSFGCHENYLVRRYVPLTMIEEQLLPFLITRQIFTGAGRMTAEGFQITQRADFLDEAVSSATTRARPMVNTRDEPHADPDSYRRLHVIIGDSNRSQFATWMKLATTHLVLCVMESAVRRGESTGFEPCVLTDPNVANRAVSRDVSCRSARLDVADECALHVDSTRMADGPGHGATALEMQYRYCTVVERFLEAHADEVDRSLPATKSRTVIEQWRTMLDDMAAGRFDLLADRVDWVAKRRLLEAMSTRHPGIATARLMQIDLDYHDVANGGTYDALLSRGALATLVDDEHIRSATHEPPQGTRALLRGRFIRAAQAAGAQYSCDWTRLTVNVPVKRDLVMLDPFDDTETDEFRSLITSMR